MNEFKYDVKSWMSIRDDADFSMYNFPFGIYQPANQPPRACSAIGDFVIDLVKLDDEELLSGINVHRQHLEDRYLNELIELGKATTNGIRGRLQSLLDVSTEQSIREKFRKALVPATEARMLLPILIRDYTDFYSSREHATNVGTMFRDPANALLPNWLHLPVGYHGRASSIVVSGTNIKRPHGQMIAADAEQPHFGATRLLDFELEMGFVIGKKSELGEPISIEQAEDHIFGLTLFNDWSARDIQKWEYVPLGPFLAKNFASTMSPWIITLEALKPFRVEGPKQEPKVLPYLQFEGKNNYDIHLEVGIQPESSEETIVCRSNFKHMYWNMIQQLAHHTVNGCNVNVGDLYASGTISGPTPDSYGSMLELSWRGTKPLKLKDGSERKFIQDGDTVRMRGYAQKDHVRVGFGSAAGKIV
jgi:fumarylacetoacetase